jgi:hypothetical protein
MLFVYVLSKHQPRFMHALFHPIEASDICQSPCLKIRDIPERIPCPTTAASGVRPRQPSEKQTDAEEKRKRQGQGPLLAATRQPQSKPLAHGRVPGLSLSRQPRAFRAQRERERISANHLSAARANDTEALPS